MKRFFVVVPEDYGKISIYRMKKWLQQHPEHLPEGFDVVNATTHQFCNGLKKNHWKARELPDRVFLIEPHVDASLVDSILEKEARSEENSEGQFMGDLKRSNVQCLTKYGFF